MTTVTRPIHFRVRQTRRRIVTEPAPPPPPGRVPRVARLMALAIKFDRMLQDGVVGSQTDLAALARVTQPRMTQIMNLLHLAPDIQEEILFLPPVTEGRDPVTERELRPVAACSSWNYQRKAWQKYLSQESLGSRSEGSAPPGRSNHDCGFDRKDRACSRSRRRKPRS